MKSYHKSGPTFVAPAPKQRVEIIPFDDPLGTIVPTASTSVQLNTTYTDRAKSFQLATLPISVAFGAGALIVAIVGYSVPVISIGALAVFWLAFLAWWLIGWFVHNIASPDGIALVQALLMFKLVRAEQIERHRRYREVSRRE